MINLICAALVLAAILFASLRVEALMAKVAIFIGLGAAAVVALLTQGETHILHEVFLVDYPQFIFIPLATVMIASLGLLRVRLSNENLFGWFLLIAVPLIGNFATTWAVVPVGLSIAYIVRRIYPERWLYILIATCVFSMNMLAVMTLLADPPQGYWAVKRSMTDNPLDFFFPIKHLGVYLIFTWALYGIMLKRLGVRFGSIENIKFGFESKWKAACGIGISVCIGIALTWLRGYQIPLFLGTVCVLVGIASVKFGHEERHNTLHWSIETVTVFIAFFAVVAFAHAGLHTVKLSNFGMIQAVIGLTLGADNAAAFAAGYPQFLAQSEAHMVWMNLLNSIAYGGTSPLGNGPQITLFLIILVGLQIVSPKQVFVTWLREACVFFPYLGIWTLTSYIVIDELKMEFTTPMQILTGLIALLVGCEAMDLQDKFRAHVDNDSGWGKRPKDEAS